MIDTLPPAIKILSVVHSALEAVDWAAIGLGDMLVRHRRNRHTLDEERPCIAIEYLADGPTEDNDSGSYLTPDEMAVSMSVSFAIDLTLPPEVTREDADMGIEDLDPTGLLSAIVVADTIKKVLKAEDSPLRQWADFASWQGQSADPDQNTPDDVRLDVAMGVIYRVLSTDPSVLLAQGEQA